MGVVRKFELTLRLKVGETGCNTFCGLKSGRRQTLHAGLVQVAGFEAVKWAKDGADRGAGEILVTSWDQDGTREGFDCELTGAVARAVREEWDPVWV